MKHSDKTSQSDNSARLDALLSDFLNKDIAAPIEPQPSSHPTSAPLGDLFPDVGAAPLPNSPTPRVQTPTVSQKVVPVNRTDVWEATNTPARRLEAKSAALDTLAADQLEKSVNSILGASTVAARGKKLLFGSVAVVLLLVAGLLIWQSPRTAVPQQPSEEPAVTVSPSEIDAPPPAQAPSGTTSEAHHGTPEADTANPPSKSGLGGGPAVPVLVPDSSESAGTASKIKGISRSTASSAARLQKMPAPTLGQSNLAQGAIQDLRSFQPALPPAPLPLPPVPTVSTFKSVVPDSPRRMTATPAVPLTKVQPVYPELARRMNVAGTVHVAIVVDTAGKVISANAIDGPPVLRGSAELAVRQWRFRPSTMNGKPVTGNGTVSVRFSPDLP